MKKRKSNTIYLVLALSLLTATTANASGSKQKPPTDEPSTIQQIIIYLSGSKQKPPVNP